MPAPRSAPTVVRPPLLAPGARVALVAPAGPLRGPSDLERAEGNARALGWEPVVGTHALERACYFAGPDHARLADLNAALADPRIDGIWCIRGGYGAMRLLPDVDFGALAARPRALIGYSDVTALHCGAAACVPGLVTFHGPTARGKLTPFSHASLERAVATGGDPCGGAPGARTVRPGRAAGRLAGGNLALLAALVGTRWAPRFAGAIVVLEDVGEAIYRVDRMLRQLLLAGAFDGCSALAFGECTDCPEECADDGRRTLDDVVAEVADALGVPAVAGLPVGHIDDQWTLPLGAPAELDADARALRAAW
jgi:muramoyltetrapeptide carboxypeptidase